MNSPGRLYRRFSVSERLVPFAHGQEATAAPTKAVREIVHQLAFDPVKFPHSALTAAAG